MVMNQLHSGAKWHFRIGGFFSFFFVIFFLSMFFGGLVVSMTLKDGFEFNPSIFSYAFFGLILLIAIAETYARLTYKFFRYEFGSEQLRIEKGIIWKKYSNIPYQRIQNIDITRGIIARICGFSSINIQTAGYSMPANGRGIHSEGYIPAVSVEEAEKIREFVIKKISKKHNSGL
jgi:uncharacterized membrane protein YdbT with pleckstrin-like domain